MLGIAGPTGAVYGFEAGNSVIAVSGPIEASVNINTEHNYTKNDTIIQCLYDTMM